MKFKCISAFLKAFLSIVAASFKNFKAFLVIFYVIKVRTIVITLVDTYIENFINMSIQKMVTNICDENAVIIPKKLLKNILIYIIWSRKITRELLYSSG